MGPDPNGPWLEHFSEARLPAADLMRSGPLSHRALLSCAACPFQQRWVDITCAGSGFEFWLISPVLLALALALSLMVDIPCPSLLVDIPCPRRLTEWSTPVGGKVPNQPWV